ncbi:hypothetical protein [Flammeovirga sp. SubArs3]|uniref:hypothetical protein n=1 Tax=Flammeovirga sp. SubArs3 TaxID=2995316 RepID=UPI00248BAE18|nr:hypothetical protein [Flammeovirga sp. SubArs3]
MFGEKIEFLRDSTFKHTWCIDLASSWTIGKWKIYRDTIYLTSSLIMDTLTILNSENTFLKDSLVLSTDEKIDRIENVEYVTTSISGGGQNRKQPPTILYFKNGKLYRLLNNKLDSRKYRARLTSKKYKPYYQPISKK